MLRVSENRRFLTWDDGRPFFYLGDTAWELFHRLNREEADRYLTDRAGRGFTVVQAVVLAELDGLTDPNPYGDLPLENEDPTRRNDAYFRHVDWIVERAAALGLFIGMLPTWGDKWNRRWGAGPEIFTPDNAREYGRFLGERYREKPILWILGGDRSIERPEHFEIIRAMAEGVRDGDRGRHLITYHPNGQHTSAEWLHAEEWLDFNMCQTGHRRDRDCYNTIGVDYVRRPVKPCLNGEPGYEHIPNGLQSGEPKLTDLEARRFAYWSLFAGAHGHTYGCNEIWQMWQPGRKSLFDADLPWYEALTLPGADQMRHARRLLEQRPFLTRLPDQSLLASAPGEGEQRVQATRDEEGSYALVYLPEGGEVRVRLDRLDARTVRAAWHDPRTGEAVPIDEYPARGDRSFTAPTGGPDWVLALDSV